MTAESPYLFRASALPLVEAAEGLRIKEAHMLDGMALRYQGSAAIVQRSTRENRVHKLCDWHACKRQQREPLKNTQRGQH